MSLAQSQFPCTAEEYLALERRSDERHEYLDGNVYAMAGETLEHGIICINLTRIISNQVLGKPCQVLSKDMRVRSGPSPEPRRITKGLYSYPDLVVVCGEPEFQDDHRDILLNPRVIIEVLSPTTEAYDRGQKFLRYRTWLGSLIEYLLVSQNQPLIEQFTRRGDSEWGIAQPVSELQDSVNVPSIGCVLPLAEVYDRITFPSATPE
jgi:Uma2 family endonuclease